MRRGQTFAEVLAHEIELGAYQPDRRAARSPHAPRTTSPHPFLFVQPRFFFNATAYASLPGAARAHWHADSAVPMPQPSRSARPATREELAFERLLGLGADLPADFTAGELRSAYRTLARRYHPDSHPESSEAARAGLSRLFAELTDNYRRLLASLEPVETIRHAA